MIKVPTKELLESVAPIEIWNLAIKQAMRSDHKRHRTGCVIYYGMDRSRNPKVYSKGCAHTHNGGLKVRSIHAEMDAVSKLPREHGGAMCLLVTLTKVHNFASVSKPCNECAKLLIKYVWGVVFAERANDGSWIVQSKSPEVLRNLQPRRYQSSSGLVS